jgi:hypothetical protein
MYATRTRGIPRAREAEAKIVTDDEQLFDLLSRTQLLEGEIRLAAIERHHDAILTNAANMVSYGVAGIQKAIDKAEARAERDADRAAKQAADQEVRQYDALTLELAKLRGIKPAEMQEIRDAAAANHRKTMSKGTYEEQLAAAAAKEADGS